MLGGERGMGDERMGSSPRFSTPEHPESNGSVERWNRVFKNMLFHVIDRDRGNWDRFVPFLLWAYREVPHDTTGVSPFQMLYGRAPVGPLSILQKTWTGEVDIPNTLREQPARYLSELRAKLKEAAEIAGLTASERQDDYATRYNRRARQKSFQKGDQVILFRSDRPGKMHAKWCGPFTVVGKQRDNSYEVMLDDGKRKTVHANNMRPYYARVGHMGVIFQDDKDFGEVECAPLVDEAAYRGLPETSTEHLAPRKEREVREIFDRYPGLFSETPRKANVGEHTISLREGFLPKRSYRYRVPELLKKEVGRQVGELLEAGLIYPSTSEYAHPVVCVSKRDGTIRLCVDYRQLNSGTTDDAFPMARQQELIFRVGAASFVTLIDLRRGSGKSLSPRRARRGRPL